MPRFDHTRTVEQTIDTQPLTSIDLSTFNGSITIETHTDPTVDMAITYKAYGETEEAAQENCEQLDCEISADSGALKIEATKPTDQWMASAAVSLKVPSTCQLKLHTSNGKITVSDLLAGVDAHTSNGTITLTNISDSVTAKTSNGTISVKNCSGSIDLSTSNGRVICSGLLAGLGNKIQTSNGRIELQLPPNQLTEITARTSNGSIKCSLPTQRITEESKKVLNAVVGEGDVSEIETSIDMRTSNGSIEIKPLPTGDLEIPQNGQTTEQGRAA